MSETLQNPHNAALPGRFPFLGLPEAWLVAGCLFQTVWNLHSGLAPTANIKDYNLFHLDTPDLSEAAEPAEQDRVGALVADLSITVAAKNQARVHPWLYMRRQLSKPKHPVTATYYTHKQRIPITPTAPTASRSMPTGSLC